MSKVEVNQVTQQCGTTLTVGGGACKTAVVDATTVTLGRCGGTVSLASGATQSGFGRTGTVDWDTSIKTGTVTAVSGSGYFVNTTSGGITVNLPAAAVGSIVAVSDYASTSASNNITVAPNGSDKINGVNDSFKINTAGLAVTLVYADATRGWKSVTGSDEDATGVVPAYVAATGGTPCAGATCGDYKIHTFTGPGTLCVSAAGNVAGNNMIDFLVVGGGGGAGGGDNAGGGGAGGYRESKQPGAPWTASPIVATPCSGTNGITAAVQGYPITVDGGGAGAVVGSPESAGRAGTSGGASSFSTISSAGGGAGGAAYPASPDGSCGANGGSGGGGGHQSTSNKGTGDTPSVTPDQGFPGGCGAAPGPVGSPPAYAAGAGGGATAAGGSGSPTAAGNGGAGGGTGINPSPSYGTPGPSAPLRYFAGGGAGGAESCVQAGCGADGGGGDAGGNGVSGTAGTVNTGGCGGSSGTRTPSVTVGAGGSGIVIIRYKFQ